MKFCNNLTLTHLYNINYNISKISKQNKSYQVQFTYFPSRLLHTLNKNGLYKTSWKILTAWNYKQYKLTKLNTVIDFNLYPLWNEFKFNALKDPKLKNIRTIFSNLYKKSQVAFKITCVQVDKKYRKKLKKKYLFQLNYIPNNYRENFFFKNLIFFIKKSEERGFFNKYNQVITQCIYSNNSPLLNIKKLIFNQLTLKNK